MRYYNHIWFVFLFLIIIQNVSAQAPNSDRGNLWKDFTYDIGNVFIGTGYAYSRPAHWHGSDFLNLGRVVAGTLSLYALDDNIRKELRGHRDKVPSILLDYGDYAGSPQNNYGFTGAVYLTGLFTKNEKLRRTGVLLISSATATGFLQQLAKSATGRARPGADLGKNHFRPFGGNPSYHSFPSGHSVLTFTNAHVIAKQFKSWWVKAPIYAVGLIPGISRIYDDAHWASDVFLSWSISYFIVESIDLFLDKKYNNKYNNTKGIPLDLNIGLGGIGVVYSF
ncbi:hypothetical protein GCM10022393_15500 [Aquimarina addita]|uniref:Phosphatidic acid phosphatase type 2/haloperoxidase domain-containing protein n=1 Tax=Aquimarina addita TaxID=870485 RepID=A0ABP7XGJ0_9FLAO